MAKSARRYEVFLPVNYNDGTTIEFEKHVAVEVEMLERFSGLTVQKREFPLRGMWQAEHRLYVDEVIIITALDFRPRGSTRFLAQLKKKLLCEFAQLEILIIETVIRVH